MVWMVKHTWITENMQANLPERAYEISENEPQYNQKIQTEVWGEPAHPDMDVKKLSKERNEWKRD